jgi:hypothetical protein
MSYSPYISEEAAMSPDLIKAMLILAAYQGAQASIGDIDTVDGTPVKPDSLVQDLGLQKKNVLVYEEAKIHYAAILRAFQDATGIWPAPQTTSSAGTALGALTSALAQLPAATPLNSVGALIQALGNLVNQAAPAPAAPASAGTAAAPASAAGQAK